MPPCSNLGQAEVGDLIDGVAIVQVLRIHYTDERDQPAECVRYTLKGGRIVTYPESTEIKKDRSKAAK